MTVKRSNCKHIIIKRIQYLVDFEFSSIFLFGVQFYSNMSTFIDAHLAIYLIWLWDITPKAVKRINHQR